MADRATPEKGQTLRWQDIRPTEGSLSSARLPRALEPRRFMLRPQSLAEAFCAAGQRLGGNDVLLARADRNAQPWARLFQKEPAYLYAEILSFRADDAGFGFAEALEQEPDRALGLILSLARTLAGWMMRIKLDTPATFKKQLEKLNKEIRLADLLEELNASGPGALIVLAEGHRTVVKAAQGGNVLGKARATRERLRSLHALLRNAVTSLKPAAQAAFDARLTSGQIDPGLGLLIAELRTAAHVDAAINELPDRHAIHYYSDIIGQTPAPASPEMVLLRLGSVPRTGVLPQGATLDARLPDGSVQKFETDAGVPISTANVGAIKLLSYQTNENISYFRALGGITGLRASTFRATGKEAAKTKPIGTLFDEGIGQTPEIGLDIASPMLSLAEGTRRIEVSLHMSRGSSLPARSRSLTEEEKAGRDDRRKSDARPEKPPLIRRNIVSIPTYANPDVRLALAADPTMVAAFDAAKIDIAIENLTFYITEFADQGDKTASMGLIYEYLLTRVESAEQLRLLLGRIVTLSMIEQCPFPADAHWENIYALVQKFREDLIGKTPAENENVQNSMIFSAFSQVPDGTIDYPPEDVFQSLLGDAFDITVSTAEGPRKPDIMQVTPVRQKRAMGGITLSLRYDRNAPALTGPDHAPRLTLRYASDARLCPVSFFEAYGIDTITIRTKVTGLRRLAAFSDDAPLVTDQTFLPFGPRPKEGSTFMVGCAEMARKPVTDIGIQLGWSSMPNPVGGFASHYEAYGRDIDIPNPELTIDYLSGDGWKPVSQGPLPLFQNEGITGALLPEWQFTGKVSGHSIPATGKVTAKEYQSRQTIRAGLVRMRLTGTAGGFHTMRYPLALVDAMRPRLISLKTRKIPPAPFIPEISRFTLSYTAEATIELNAPDTARPGEEIHQISPFGSLSLFPKRTVKQARVFPKRMGFGQICFQLTGPNATGPTALVVSFAASGHLRRVPSPNPVAWVYLTENGWHALPETALSSDTTAGLMRSGIIVIDMPEDAATDTTMMPGGGVWLSAVAMQPNLEVFPALADAQINGVWARRRDETWKDTETVRKWSFNPAQPGLSDIVEIPTPSQTRPPEPRDTFVARTGERLRHRRRAVTPWDMERMVLQEFPDVWMAKCLPHMSRETPAPVPGQVTLVVTRQLPEQNVVRDPAPVLFDVATLDAIRVWLEKYSSEGARIDVVNPTFERLQVRAKIVVRADRENGAMAQMLRRDLARYLSVWTADPSMRRFGWSLNVHMLRAHVADLPYVKKVSDFSVLHLTGDDHQSYELFDTAQDRLDPRGTYGPILRPRFPWSLPLSTRDHILTILPELNDETPTAAGIGSLTLGDMLIVGQRTNP